MHNTARIFLPLASLLILSLAIGLHAQPVSPTTADNPSPELAENSLEGDFYDDVTSKDWPQLLHSIWTAKLFNAGDTTIHLNQLVIALFIAIVGLWIARRISFGVQRRLLKIKRFNVNSAAMFQKIVFIILAVVTLFIALPIAGVPITIFTVLGGALAIGVGFGAQNLFNNLISGLILMTERPIRIGDIVEIQEQAGRIEDIGNRCTRVRRFDGVDVLVPNSRFLEEPVVNWTLKDADIRGSVTVGIAYGSNTAQARDLIRACVDEHPKVHRNPEPAVLFTDFGDNALGFEVLFWTAVNSPMDMRTIQSDLRYAIDDKFRAAHISIAFPQRDLHLDTLKPLEVRIKNDDAT